MSGKIRIGIVYEGSKDPALLAGRVREAEKIAEALHSERYEAVILGLAEESLGAFDHIPPVDILYPSAVGPGPEAYRLYALAAAKKIPCAGPGPKAAALGFDRILARKLLAGERIPQCLFRSFTRSQWEKDKAFYLIEIEVTLGYPCRIFPGDGSGLAEGRAVHSREELELSVQAAFLQSDRVMAEELVKGRLFAAAVAVSESSYEVAVAEAGEAGTGGEYLTAAAGPREEPASTGEAGASGSGPSLTAEAAEAVRRLAVKASSALDARGPALFYFVTCEGHDLVLLAGAELFPAFGPGSPYAGVWLKAGKSYKELASRLVEQALDNGPPFSPV